MTTAPHKPKWYQLSLSKQILLGLIVGALLGWLAPRLGQQTALLRDIFLHLIQCMIAPLIFGSIVQGIAGHGDLKKVGRMGLKALIYFEVVTALALAVGLLVVNVIRPGAGVELSGDVGALGKAASTPPATFAGTVLHAFPTSIFGAMASNEVLQIVIFSAIFAVAVGAAGEKGKPILNWCSSLTEVMFKFAGLIMKAAPFGVGAAVAATVGEKGIGVLFDLSKLVLTTYVALIIFVICVFGLIIWLARIPFRPFARAVSEPFTLAFATANSEAALPDAFAKMERFGVPPGIVGFVLPAGYSFNLDGSTLYLAVASVFIAQANETMTGMHFGLGQQLAMMAMLLLTSKGVAAVPRASLVVLIAGLNSFHLPLAGAAMILAVDAFMDMARTSVNVLGNCLASVVIARWEGEFNEKQALREFGGSTPRKDKLLEGNPHH